MRFDHDVRSWPLHLATLKPVQKLMAPITRDRVPIFMLHRMEDKSRGVDGFPAAKLRDYLRYLERRGKNFVSLEDIFRRVSGASRAPLDDAIAFTMDDGFADQVDIALPIFKEFSCPVTLFLITGFIDGKLWPWDDQVAYVFRECRKRVLTTDVAGNPVTYDISTGEYRKRARRDFRAKCKQISHENRVAAVSSLSAAAEVSIPVEPPLAYSPTTWEDVRSAESDLVRFGPHTQTHGIVSRMPPDMAAGEISESWARLSAEVSNPLSIFAWPNGQSVDFGPREMANLEDEKFQGAVTTEPRFADTSTRYKNRFARFQVGRFSIPDSFFDLMQYTSWVAHLKWVLSASGMRAKFGGRRPFAKYSFFKLVHRIGGFRRHSRLDWVRIDRLIFVCKGNICRSPYAEYKAKEFGMVAVSAGIDATGISSANENALWNATYRDIDLSKHVSKNYSQINLSKGDLVVCMSPRQYRIVSKAVRGCGAQTTLLGLFADNRTPYIPDPYGGDDEYFQICFQIIDEALTRIRTKWKSVAI